MVSSSPMRFAPALQPTAVVHPASTVQPAAFMRRNASGSAPCDRELAATDALSEPLDR